MHTRFAALAAAGVLTLTIAVGVPASAQQQRPLEGTAACTALVDADASVLALEAARLALQNRLDALPADATDAQRSEAEGAVETAEASVTAQRAVATDQLCAPATGGGTDPGTGDPDDPDTDNPVITFDSVRALIAALDCDGYQQQLGRINDQVLTLIGEGRLTNEQQGILTDELSARRDELDECFVAPTLPGDGGTVDPVGDDGSTANTSGSQVTDVPVGSAQTGA